MQPTTVAELAARLNEIVAAGGGDLPVALTSRTGDHETIVHATVTTGPHYIAQGTVRNVAAVIRVS